jgi:hypothetical protein
VVCHEGTRSCFTKPLVLNGRAPKSANREGAEEEKKCTPAVRS